jgi:hypothetical protein
MCLEEKLAMNPIIRTFDKLSKTQKEWFWFVFLWCASLISVLLLAKIIRLMMGL